MSIPNISGRQARNLLDGTTPGPWEAGPSMTLSTTVAVFSHGYGPVAFVSNREGGVDEVPALTDGALAAAAPTLAATVAWLYGQTGQDQWGDWELDHHDPYYQFAAVRPDGEGRISLAVGPYGQEILLDPDEAVDVARALLTAAEEARP